MKYIKQMNDEAKRAKVRLSEIERILRRERIIVPPPSRTKLIALCEDGTFETAGTKPGPFGWLVYEDSFLGWLKSLDGDS